MTRSSSPIPETLISQARKGDHNQLGQLLERYRRYLRLLTRLQIDQRLQGKVDASDVVQETLFQAHQSFSEFQGTTEAEFLAWLRTIMASKVANLVRRFLGTQSRDVRLERELRVELDHSSGGLERSLADSGSSPSEGATRRERVVLLADALERLPPDYREVMILHHLKGHPLPEVARQLGKSVESVRKLWARGLANMRTLLKESS